MPTWGVGKKAAEGWHHSYVHKILGNRSVLGAFIPHTTKAEGSNEGGPSVSISRAVGAVLKSYYPRVLAEAVFKKVHLRRPGPRGPVGWRISNLFQGLLKDGDLPNYTLGFKDHGEAWQYLHSDHRRVYLEEPILSWPDARLEILVLNYLLKLDWSDFTVERNLEIRKLILIEGVASFCVSNV